MIDWIGDLIDWIGNLIGFEVIGRVVVSVLIYLVLFVISVVISVMCLAGLIGAISDTLIWWDRYLYNLGILRTAGAKRRARVRANEEAWAEASAEYHRLRANPFASDEEVWKASQRLDDCTEKLHAPDP
jgi:hypothetical protein